jgi:hypothetical protein
MTEFRAQLPLVKTRTTSSKAQNRGSQNPSMGRENTKSQETNPFLDLTDSGLDWMQLQPQLLSQKGG